MICQESAVKGREVCVICQESGVKGREVCDLPGERCEGATLLGVRSV